MTLERGSSSSEQAKDLVRSAGPRCSCPKTLIGRPGRAAPIRRRNRPVLARVFEDSEASKAKRSNAESSKSEQNRPTRNMSKSKLHTARDGSGLSALAQSRGGATKSD